MSQPFKQFISPLFFHFYVARLLGIISIIPGCHGCGDISSLSLCIPDKLQMATHDNSNSPIDFELNMTIRLH